MANATKKKNQKRFECLKKKAKELSILCHVEVLFLCKEDDDDPSTNSFESWPEDRNSCLSLIDKYKNSSVPAKQCNKKTVLGKKKNEMSDTQMEDLSRNVQENVEFEVGFVDGDDFEDTQSTNVQENGEFEVGFVDGVDFDDFYSKFCEPVEETQSKNVQENGEFEEAFVDGDDFDNFFGKFCESVEKTQMVLCDNDKDFDKFFQGLEFDENCLSFCESEDKLDLSFFEGPAFDENRRLVEESEKSKIVTCQNVPRN